MRNINYINFIDKTKKEIVNYYTTNLKEDFSKDFIEGCINKIISNYKKKYVSNIEIDIHEFSFFYEELIPYHKRKLSGEIYTPKSIVCYILDMIGYNSKNKIENKKIIDVSCGSGSFIIEIIKRFLLRYCEKYNVNDIIELNNDLLKRLIRKIRENIHGIDINPIACILCQLNIHFLLFNAYNKIIEKENNFSFPIFSIYNKNSLTISTKYKYNYVVGNPPYLFVRDIPDNQKLIIESQNFKTKIGQYDYYQIFIELGIKFLREKGFMGYIVPDSLLVLSNRANIRNYIKNNTKIKKINYIGPKFDSSVVSNIIIILQKEKNKIQRYNNEIHVSFLSSKSIYSKKVSQAELDNWDDQFLIHLDLKDISILNHLNQNFPKIKDLLIDSRFNIKINRGVELSKDGMIFYCNKCNKYYPLPKSKEKKCRKCEKDFKEDDIERIILDQPLKEESEDYRLYIYSINRYKIKKYKFINIKKDGIRYKSLDSYVDRIIIRQINQKNLICATYYKDLSFCSQSYYNLKIISSTIQEFDNFYQLGLINSHLLSYYFMKSFGSYKKLFPRILIEKIKFLPIKIPVSENEKIKAQKIRSNIKIILELNKKNGNGEIMKKIQKKVDNEVYELYQIDMKNQEHIEKYFKE